MKAAAVATLILMMSTITPLQAAPVAGSLGLTKYSPPAHALVLIQAKKNNKKKRIRRERGPPYIPGWVPTAYGRKDCIGWWHWHADEGWYHCHGQLIGSK